MRETASKQRSTILTVWIVLSLLYHGAGALNGVLGFGATLWARHYVVSGQTDTALAEREITRQDAESAIANTLAWSAAYIVTRVASAAFVVWLFFWKRVAFGCYCASIGVLFAVNLWGGDTVWEASIDLVGLGVLAGLLHLVEPAAWPQLD